MIEFLPEDPEVVAKIDGKAAFAEMGASHNIVEGGRHPYMHRTDSLDYAMVIEGEIWMVMDEEEDDLLLKKGDTLVQRGNNHAWLLGRSGSHEGTITLGGMKLIETFKTAFPNYKDLVCEWGEQP